MLITGPEAGDAGGILQTGVFLTKQPYEVKKTTCNWLVNVNQYNHILLILIPAKVSLLFSLVLKKLVFISLLSLIVAYRKLQVTLLSGSDGQTISSCV